jgi:hypothetical protein
VKILSIVTLVFSLVINELANRLPLNGVTPVELSDRYANFFVPAGVTFAIWGVIYLLLLMWTVAQFLGPWRELGEKIAPFFALSSLLNGGWVLVWHYDYKLVSIGVMLGILATMWKINRILLEEGSGVRLLLPRAAFGIYLGWILVATVANVTAVLVAFGATDSLLGISAPVWAILLVLVAGGIGGATLVRLRNAAIGLALVWAVYGIVLKRSLDQPNVALTAWATLAALGIVTAWVFVRPGEARLRKA